MTIRQRSLTIAIAVIIAMACPSLASETSVFVSRPFVEVSGGSDFYIEGVGVNPTASFQLGLGYRWPQLALGGSFGWTHNLDWDVGALCPRWDGSTCGSNYDPRDLFGAILYGKLYPVIVAEWLQPYVQAGMGFFLLNPESSEAAASWAYAMRVGIGVEVGLSELISLNLEVFYSNIHFPPPNEWDEGRESHIVNTSGGLVIYF
jgi:opacity protein-like surface antigen